MSITKKIKFYVFVPQPSLYNNGLNPRTTIEALKMVFPECKDYICKYSNENYIIDILEIGENYVFGAISKNNDLKYSSFYQLRDKQTHKATPYSSVSPDTQLEAYTFFYINCSQNRMAVLQHKNIGQIHHILSEGIFDLSQNTLMFFCAPEKIGNIGHTTRRIKRDKRLSISFAPGASKYEIRNLTQTLGDIQYDSYSINLKLSSSNPDSSLDKLFDIVSKDKKLFKEIKLSGKDEYGLEETVDFIETLFTQSVSFDLTENMAINAQNIKEKLAEALHRN